MSRLPWGALIVLVAATIAAFFVTQHLKVSDPLINGDPRPDPPAIDPLHAGVCRDLLGARVSFRQTHMSFYLQAHPDTASVYVLNASGARIGTVSNGRRMRLFQRSTFTWDGRSSEGRLVAPGSYYFEIYLHDQGRYDTLASAPVRVITSLPHPLITAVSEQPGPSTSSSSAGGLGRSTAATPGQTIALQRGRSLTIHFRPGPYLTARVLVYRLARQAGAGAKLVGSFSARGKRGIADWDGLIDGRPAPAASYLLALQVSNRACDPGSFPAKLPPTPQQTVEVRLLT